MNSAPKQASQKSAADIMSQLTKNLRAYFRECGLSDADFSCRDCGKPIVDVGLLNTYSFVKWIQYEEKILNGSTICFKKPVFRKTDRKTGKSECIASEPEEFRWFLFGKHLKTCNKIFFRHICWDCFYAKLGSAVDIRQKARKSKWYSRVEAGEKPIPVTNVGSSDYFKLLFDMTDEELQGEKLKLATGSLERLVLKYGQEEGQKKFEAYSERQAYTNSAEYMMETRGMTLSEWKEYNASRAITLDNLVRRYGEEEGKSRWKNYCANEAYAGNSLQYFIDKYGEEEGKKKYDEVCKKKTAMKNYSDISQELFREIDAVLGDLAANSFYATKNYEKEIVKRNGNIIQFYYKVDYCLGNKIIEFNGDYWHANPRTYKADDVIDFFGRQKLAKEVWDENANRNSAICGEGYEMKIVWEMDYMSKKDEVVAECVKWLKASGDSAESDPELCL